MYSALSPLKTTTDVPLSKTPNPQLLPGHRSINGLLRVCVHGVCVFTAVCALWMGKCKALILSMGHHSWLYVTSLFKKSTCPTQALMSSSVSVYKIKLKLN